MRQQVQPEAMGLLDEVERKIFFVKGPSKISGGPLDFISFPEPLTVVRRIELDNWPNMPGN